MANDSTLNNEEFQLKNLNSTSFEFISGEEAMEKLKNMDDFLSNFSQFDLKSRTNLSSPTLEDYFQDISQHILLWDDQSITSVRSSIKYLNTTCFNQLKYLIFPSKIFLILTDGKIENNAAYCRNGNVVVFPKELLYSKDIFIHELFHIWSKTKENSILRDRLYEIIGFHQIPSDKSSRFPPLLNDLKITNPDAPLVMKYYINLRKSDDSDKKVYKCSPILYSCRSFDQKFSTNFFDYLIATTIILDDETFQPVEPLQFLSYENTKDFYKQIGQNTHYIIHPEEILADNFVLWIKSTENQQQIITPEIIYQINQIILNVN
ncbi:unnamed protein product [Adineta ricciae]|uniref:Uncharacterized protein n=1 Tax=Adineta ricciae TaxID=249248 RepID=A0A815AP69_ADIRI|nr:unnamed protein product [Adineta ricciae]CAF1437849.1 unnamed protein product [Adineta ricciae]